MIEVTRSNKSNRARVVDAIRIRVDALVQLGRSAQRQRPEKNGGSEERDKSTRVRAASHRTRASVRPTMLATTFCEITSPTASSCPLSTGNTLILFLLVFRPKVKRVGENDVAH
jgi:hypothetical protein